MRIALPLLIGLGFPLIGIQASPFQNLDFDSANTNNLSNSGGFFSNPPYQNVGYGTPADLIPGWHVLYGTSDYQDLYWLNLNSVGGALVSIYDKNNFLNDPHVHVPVEGKYSFALEPDALTSLSLVQIGDIPADAQSIHFTGFGGAVRMIVNGSLVPLTYTYGPPTGTLDTRLASVDGDISSFAGQTVELKFMASQTPFPTAGLFGLDSIYFAPVPEPATEALLGMGLLSLGTGLVWRAKDRKPQTK